MLVDALQKFEMDVIRDKGRAEAGTLVATPVPDFSKYVKGIHAVPFGAILNNCCREESSTSATQLSS